MSNIANIIRAVPNNCPALSSAAAVAVLGEAQPSAPPLEKKKSARRRRASDTLTPPADPNTSSIVQTAGKPSEPAAAPVEKISKSDCVLRLLKRERGATIGDIMAATNWQAHSVRGFLSGTVRRKMATGA